MLSFKAGDNEHPPRGDKPHICADGQTIFWHDALSGFRIGFAEEGHAFPVAEAVLANMRRRAEYR